MVQVQHTRRQRRHILPLSVPPEGPKGLGVSAPESGYQLRLECPATNLGGLDNLLEEVF
jgi:hypothetical protein